HPTETRPRRVSLTLWFRRHRRGTNEHRSHPNERRLLRKPQPCSIPWIMKGRRQFRAVFERGVLRPLEEIDVQEGEVVEVLIPAASWEEDIEDVLRERSVLSSEFSADEVERDVAQAIADLRREQRVP
ncbi:MAG: antitoxin family protein, partial [Pseudomonadota bacterium]